MNPADIRKHLRQKRNALTPSKQSNNAEQAFIQFKKLLQSSVSFQTPQKIALYLAQDSELSTDKAIQFLWNETEHEVYLPVLETRDDWHMAFVRYTKQSEMQSNQFGIKEPYAPHSEHLSGEKMDWVFMPLVGFDCNGNRLGMGGGYYDRTFALKLETKANQTKLIGWAHQCQKTTEPLPKEPWDVPLDGVITELGFKTFN